MEKQPGHTSKREWKSNPLCPHTAILIHYRVSTLQPRTHGLNRNLREPKEWRVTWHIRHAAAGSFKRTWKGGHERWQPRLLVVSAASGVTADSGWEQTVARAPAHFPASPTEPTVPALEGTQPFSIDRLCLWWGLLASLLSHSESPLFWSNERSHTQGKQLSLFPALFERWKLCALWSQTKSLLC